MVKRRDYRNGLLEYVECCYSCISYTVPKNGTKGVCKLNGELCNPVTHKCNKWKDAELMQCDECGIWVRLLGSHVRAHGMTASEYKEKHGYNRTTALASKATSKAISESITPDRVEGIKKNNYWKHNTAPSNQSKGYSQREEARMHMVIAKSNISEETRKRMSIAQTGIAKGRGVEKSAEHRNSIRQGIERYFKTHKRVVQKRDAKGKILAWKDIAIKTPKKTAK